VARKRAPGGGRKPIGPSAARPLTIRIPDDMRAVLQTAAVKRSKQNRGWNLSQELLLRLRWTLNKEHERDRDAALRALSFLISEVSRYLNPGLSPNWHRDPFLFGAFRFGVSKILEALEPPGKAQSPLAKIGTLSDTFRTPEAAGEMAASVTLSQLLYPASEADHLATLQVLEKVPVPEHLRSFHEQILDDLQRNHYTISRARSDLGIDEPKEPKS